MFHRPATHQQELEIYPDDLPPGSDEHKPENVEKHNEPDRTENDGKKDVEPGAEEVPTNPDDGGPTRPGG
jgi:hypothetical protein